MSCEGLHKVEPVLDGWGREIGRQCSACHVVWPVDHCVDCGEPKGVTAARHEMACEKCGRAFVCPKVRQCERCRELDRVPCGWCGDEFGRTRGQIRRKARYCKPDCRDAAVRHARRIKTHRRKRENAQDRRARA